ncbi:hypothetical protein [Saccharopolyspora phatthalungensis]|uniref:Uncharacterized protein n=1 Tax=Saccharopolyspora phatthalungensis TaxID=664693 RepID=A0A840Q2V8_9PSEU|nr:hypothetical protein [Saccharopolyspora phatthalungensis]MBB5154317.1 hypothetical protein [Saccharopolyspora phatthalungensis]
MLVHRFRDSVAEEFPGQALVLIATAWCGLYPPRRLTLSYPQAVVHNSVDNSQIWG